MAEIKQNLQSFQLILIARWWHPKAQSAYLETCLKSALICFPGSDQQHRVLRDSNPDLATASPNPRCWASCPESNRGRNPSPWSDGPTPSSATPPTRPSRPTKPPTLTAADADDEWRDRETTPTTNRRKNKIESSFLSLFDLVYFFLGAITTSFIHSFIHWWKRCEATFSRENEMLTFRWENDKNIQLFIRMSEFIVE